MSLNERREHWKKEMKVIKKHNDIRLMHEEAVRFDDIIELDPTLNGYYRRFMGAEQSTRALFMAVRCLATFGRNFYEEPERDHGEEEIPEELDRYFEKLIYVAPRTRIRITDDIHLSNDTHRIPVYTDAKGETLKTVKIPNPLLYDHIINNMVDKVKEPLLYEAIKIAGSSENVIRCKCCSQDPVVNCFDNKDCPCFIANQFLQSRNKTTDTNEKLKFHTFQPLMYNDGNPTYYNTVGFACSPKCACKGACTNNATYLIQKKLYSIEIYRADPQIGFGIRSTLFIPAGTPIIEYCGELVDGERLHSSLENYSYQLTDCEGDKHLYNLLREKYKNNPEYYDVLDELSKHHFHLDAKMQGSVGRFANHSCTPNMEPLRLFKEGFTPANMRMIFFTLKDIFPGEPLTLDYGSEYKVFRRQRCLCRTFACRSGPHYEKFSNLDGKLIASCFVRLHHASRIRYSVDLQLIERFYSVGKVEEVRVDPCVSFSKYNLKWRRQLSTATCERLENVIEIELSDEDS